MLSKMQLPSFGKCLDYLPSIALIALLLPVGFQVSLMGIDFSIRLFHIAAILCLFSLNVKAFKNNFKKIYPFVIFMILICVSILVGITDKISGLKVLINIISFIAIGTFVFSKAAINFLEKKINIFILAGTFLACGAILLYILGAVGLLSNELLSQVIIVDRHQYRLKFPFGDPNFVGLHLLFFFFCSFYFLKGSKRTGFLILFSVAMLITLSNSLFIALVLTLFLFEKIYRFRILQYGVICLSIGLLFGMAYSSHIFEFCYTTLNKYTYGSGRLELWQASLELVADHWLFGLGWGSAPQKLLQTIGVRQEIHNTLLDFLFGMGICGLAVYSLIWSKIFKASLYLYQRSRHFLPSIALAVFLMTQTISTYMSPVFVAIYVICLQYSDQEDVNEENHKAAH